MTVNEVQLKPETVPPPGLLVLVQCEGFRCMAYRTTDDRWMSAFTHEELEKVVRVLDY